VSKVVKTVELNIWDGEKHDEHDMPSVGILQTLDVEFVDGEWRVTGEEGGTTWHGRGENQHEAVLNWLADRLGLR
jgi:hypothetical protein